MGFFMANPTSPRSYIQELGSKNGINNDTAVKVTQGIELALTSFKNMGCFVNEFLQNANDQALDNQFIEVSFTLIGSELIIYHNGKPFSQEDVTRICDYGDADHNQKSEKADQTGYKDIGFKSVFKVAYRVYVFSEEWRFHFDEKNPRWKTKPGENRYPWQIAPLWTKENDPGISQAAQAILHQRGRTTFVCCLNADAVPEVQRELLQFKKYPENILFLSKTRRVSISINSTSFSIENRNDTLLIDEAAFNVWKRISDSVLIPKKVKDYLVGLKSFQCPRRLQKAEFTHAPLSFCFPMNADEFMQNHGIRFFCSLPVGVMGDSPILVNAPFLLDLSREGLPNNVWNEFLIKEIAKANFKYMKSLFEQQSRVALRVLAPNVLMGISDQLQAVFRAQMEKCQKEAFLPPQVGNNLLKIVECTVDPTGFYKHFYAAKVVLPDAERFVHPDIDAQELLKRFPISKMTLDKIITQLPNIVNLHPDLNTCLLILRYFCRIFQINNRFAPDQLNLFKTQKFVLNTHLQRTSLDDVHLPLESKQAAVKLPSCLPLPVIHPDLLNDGILDWLKQIHLKPLTADTILDYYRKNLNHSTLEKKESNIKIIQLLFNLFLQKEIRESDVRALKGILLLTKSGETLPSNGFVE